MRVFKFRDKNSLGSGSKRGSRRRQVRDTLDSRCRRTAFEPLEERALLTVAQDLVSQLTPYQTALTSALDVATSLPLVGSQLADVQEFDTVLQDALQSLETQTQGITNDGHYDRIVALPSLAKTFTFDLGLDAFLQGSVVGGVSASINPVLNVGFDYQGGTVSLDALETSLDLGFSLSLPNLVATMSFNSLLFTRAVDDGTSFQGNLGFEFNTSGGLTPSFSGDAHVRMLLTMSFVDPALNASFNPTFRTTLDLDWGFGANNQLTAPSIQLQNFGLEADGFLHGFLGDVVTTVQKFTKPIQPFIEIFETPVPIISAFGSSETIGTLLLKGSGQSQEQQDRFAFMLKIVKAVNSIDLSSGTGGAVIPFGTITLTGNAQQAGAFGFDTSLVTGAIDDIFGIPALQTVKDTLEKVGNYAGLTSTAGFKFPLLENPGPVIGAILTGQTQTMFSYSTGRQHFELAPSIGVGIPGVLGLFLSAGVIFDANLTMGYDTAGLIAFKIDPSHNPSNLLHGFYFDNSIDVTAPPIPNHPPVRQTGLYLQGLATISASLGVTVSGGLYANIDVELVHTDPSSHVHLDTMLSNLTGGGKVFKLSGKVYASADISLALSLPVGPDITLFSYNLGYDELLNFDPPPPPDFGLPVTVVDVTNQHTVLLDVNKMAVGSRVTVQPFHDLTVPNGFAADGIRVDYPTEVFLFVERKNDATTNFYNFVGLNGTVPDGVSINVIDPFRVFVDEGAPNPYPVQTKPGVLLTGGKNVVYRYSELYDGTRPNVLLVGGYGSNTLTGGTMMFGNFIPGDRIAQAKAHFADTSGFDGAGLGLINSVIDAAIAPVNPAGIIGAKMTGNRGGLMFGGPGNNSFFATGAGAYEMVGGAWVNSFSISPSFNGAPATYQIDGGPFGQSQLVVRVPADERVTFENSTVVDKYNSSLKALAVEANAGLSATAHGIHKVQIVAASGSRVVIGDTSELDIEFSIAGGAHLTFGGTNAPDVFDVSTSGYYYDHKNHFTVPKFAHMPDGSLAIPAPYGLILPSRFPDPIYSITRTFGTNGRTQTIPFAVGDAYASSIELDAGGASDTYNLTLGVGAFVDVTVNDSDTSNQNALTVNVRDSVLSNNKVELTDNSLHLDYYTDIVFHDALAIEGSGYWNYFAYASSVHYMTSVYFGANNNITFASAFRFVQTIIDRPTAPQVATILIDGQYYTSFIPSQSFGPQRAVFDASAPNPTIIDFSVLPLSIEVLANAGTLNVTSLVGGNIEVLGNAGTLNINSLTVLYGLFQVNIGSGGSLANVHGAINLSNPNGLYGLKIDDRTNPGPGGMWAVSTADTKIGDLTLNYAGINASPLDNVSKFEAFSKAGTPVTLFAEPPFYTLQLNGVAVPYWYLFDPPSVLFNSIGDAVSILPSLAGDLDGVVYSASNLPLGLSIDSTTGLISGVIDELAYLPGAYQTILSVIKGSVARGWYIDWHVTGITFMAPSVRANHLGDSVNLAIQATSVSGAPVIFSAQDLPSGLSIDPDTGVISGTVGGALVSAELHYATITATLGNDAANHTIAWSVLPVGQSNAITFYDPGYYPGNQTNREGDYVYVYVYAASSLYLPLVYSVQGLPPGVKLVYDADFDYYSLQGTIQAGTAIGSPYHVTIVAMDGLWSGEVTFEWFVAVPGTVDVSNPGTSSSLINDTVAFGIQASSSLSQPLTYSASGLPNGLSIDPQTGVISGTVLPLASLPSLFDVSVSVTDGTSTYGSTFVWRVSSSYQLNIISLPRPVGSGFFDIVSPAGTYLSASISAGAGVASPAGVMFPFGFVTLTISGLLPGAAADVTIVGLDVGPITDYYKYGATPANPSNHWYNFLFGQQTDTDNAVGTGMEIVGGNLVLHLVDGGRGDDDLAANGVIFDIGGPAIETVNQPPTADPGGPYAISEGNSLPLDASASWDSDGDALSYSWDVNGDGQFGDALGVSPTVTAVQLAGLGIGPGNVYNVRVQVSDGEALSTSLPTTLTVLSPAAVVGRHLFYNQSGTSTRYDGNNLAINASDDAAIAADKTAYLWEDAGAATFANVSSYTKGINGIMVDISGSHPSITADDFIFRVGNNNSPGTWTTANAPTSISVRAGAGVGGSDRVTIIWNGAAAPIKQWLNVIVLANADTGLPQKVGYPAGHGDQFFFGNAVGNTGFGDTTANSLVTAADEAAIRANPALISANIPITNLYDVGRNASVSALDESAARLNGTNPSTTLKYLNLTSAPAAPEADGGIISPLFSGDSVSGDSGVASALTAPTTSVAPSLPGVPSWITTRLASVELNSGAPARLFQHLHDANTPRSRALLEKFDAAADALGLDDTLLDLLLSDLGLE